MAARDDLYRDSWWLYKGYTETFQDDVSFYRDFCRQHRSLELFAGYGRVANPLMRQGVDLETVELSPVFAKFINLPTARNHVCDVLCFQPTETFGRIFAAYNSFCLLTEPAQQARFFRNLRLWLSDGGRASLSYYSADHWKDAVPGEFTFEDQKIAYIPKWDLSERRQGFGTWIDEYHFGRRVVQHTYRVKLHEDPRILETSLAPAGLKLHSIVRDFQRKSVSEPGWIDFIVEKAS